jgi:WD40 repeat protein
MKRLIRPRSIWLGACVTIMLLAVILSGCNALAQAQQPPSDNPPSITQSARLGRGRLQHLSLSPDRKTLAVISSRGIWMVDPATLQPRYLLAKQGRVIWSPDGSKFATVNGDKIRVWRTQDGRALQTFTGLDAAWSPDGQQLAKLNIDHTIGVRDIGSGARLRKLPLPTTTANRFNRLAWSPDGKTFALGGLGIVVLDATDGHILKTIEPKRSVGKISWSPDGTKLIASTTSGRYQYATFLVYDAHSGRQIEELNSGNPYETDPPIWSPDGAWLAATGVDRDSGLYRSTASGQLQKVMSFGGTTGWSADSRLLAVGLGNTIEVWDTAANRRLRSLTAAGNNSMFIAWLADDTQLLSADAGPAHTLRLLDAVTGKEILTSDAQRSYASDLAWSPDGTRFAFIDDDGAALVWDARTGETVQTLKSGESRSRDVAWSPDGKRLISGGEDKQLRLWDATTGQLLRTMAGQWSTIADVDWSPDGKRLASAGDWLEGSVIVWDAANGQQLTVLPGNQRGTAPIEWSPDGVRLAGITGDERYGGNKAVIWDAAGTHELEGVGKYVSLFDMAWSPDGKLLAASGLLDQGIVLLWDTRTGKLVQRLSGPGIGNGVTWSPDGKRLATIGGSVIQLWDTTTWQAVSQHEAPRSGGRAIAWSPDGTRLAVGMNDGTIQVWKYEPNRSNK